MYIYQGSRSNRTSYSANAAKESNNRACEYKSITASKLTAPKIRSKLPGMFHDMLGTIDNWLIIEYTKHIGTCTDVLNTILAEHRWRQQQYSKGA